MRASHVVVITGASSGIGRALALEWAKRRASIVLAGRNEAHLRAVASEVVHAGGDALAIAGDVTDDAYRAALVERTVRERGRIDVLVNNAGRGYYAAFRDLDMHEMERLFALNVIAPVRLAQLAIEPLMRSQGAIVMLSSVAGVVAAPHLGAYAASKYALEALSIAMRAELRHSGVRVVVVRPGPVDTPFRENAVTKGVPAGVRPKAARPQTAEEIARQTVRAVDRDKPVVETSLFVRVASFASRVTPPVYRLIVSRMAK